jgi:AcrR family transcriptional regulator
MDTTELPGRRERKKRATRDAIYIAARTLFMKKGFDAVTVAEIAEAADVSEKTVFNHFATKEDLALAGSQERLEKTVEALELRFPDESVLDVFRRMTAASIDQIETDPVDQILAVPRMVRGSATLQKRLMVDWERDAGALTPAVAAAAGVPEDDLVAALVARSFAWIGRLIFRQAVVALLDGQDQKAVAARLRVEADRAYDQLSRGLADYGVRH